MTACFGLGLLSWGALRMTACFGLGLLSWGALRMTACLGWALVLGGHTQDAGVLGKFVLGALDQDDGAWRRLGGERSFAPADDAHLSDDEAVAKMGHPSCVMTMGSQVEGLLVFGGFAWGFGVRFGRFDFVAGGGGFHFCFGEGVRGGRGCALLICCEGLAGGGHGFAA
jgi:hypothetical protein